MTLTLLAAGYAQAQGPAQLNLVPMPASVQLTGGASLRVDASFSVRLGGYREPRLYRAVQRFLNQLSCATALPISQAALPQEGLPMLVHWLASLLLVPGGHSPRSKPPVLITCPVSL